MRAKDVQRRYNAIYFIEWQYAARLYLIGVICLSMRRKELRTTQQCVHIAMRLAVGRKKPLATEVHIAT